MADVNYMGKNLCCYPTTSTPSLSTSQVFCWNFCLRPPLSVRRLVLQPTCPTAVEVHLARMDDDWTSGLIYPEGSVKGSTRRFSCQVFSRIVLAICLLFDSICWTTLQGFNLSLCMMFCYRFVRLVQSCNDWRWLCCSNLDVFQKIFCDSEVKVRVKQFQSHIATGLKSKVEKLLFSRHYMSFP